MNIHFEVSFNFIFQDDYIEALNKLNLTVTKAYKINSNIKFEVFIHKVDGLGDDFKMESQRDIHQRATDDLNDSGKPIVLPLITDFLYLKLSRL